MAKETETPAGAVIEKIIGEELIDQLKATSEKLKGTALGGLTEAADKIKASGNRSPFFDPSLAQYKQGLVLYFDPEHSIVREVPVGTGTSTAIVCTIPAGMKHADGSVVFNKVFNAYISTFRKTIRVTDQYGEPVLTELGEQKTLTGENNAIWDEMQACEDEPEVLRKLSGRKLECTKVEHDFGPSNFVGEIGNRRPTGHRLTSLPLFKEFVG